MTSESAAAQGRPRRDTLAAYGVRGDEPDAGFDALVGLAAEICQTPMAAVTLLDDSRQWYKAERGIGVTSVRLEDSFCLRALDSGQEVTVVPNATTDA
ncbi:MAG: histidine kinase, partial [Actinomycetota bacterium]|nr:histidine kinase [Actinomycetota bacterium]